MFFRDWKRCLKLVPDRSISDRESSKYGINASQEMTGWLENHQTENF